MHWPILGAMAAMIAGLPGRVAAFHRHGPPFMAVGLGCAMRLVIPPARLFLLPLVAAGKFPVVWVIWTVLLLSELGALHALGPAAPAREARDRGVRILTRSRCPRRSRPRSTPPRVRRIPRRPRDLPGECAPNRPRHAGTIRPTACPANDHIMLERGEALVGGQLFAPVRLLGRGTGHFEKDRRPLEVKIVPVVGSQPTMTSG